MAARRGNRPPGALRDELWGADYFRIRPYGAPSRSRSSKGLSESAAPSPTYASDSSGRADPEYVSSLRAMESVYRLNRALQRELLERVLALSLPEREAKNVASKMIRHFGSAKKAIAADLLMLTNLFGLNEKTVGTMSLIRMSCICLMQPDGYRFRKLRTRIELANYLVMRLSAARSQQYWIIHINETGQVIEIDKMIEGTVDGVWVYPQEIAKRAIEVNSVGIVLAQNHPSGDPTPSGADLYITVRVYEALRLLNISLEDHLIVGNGCWLSLRDSGFVADCWRNGHLR